MSVAVGSFHLEVLDRLLIGGTERDPLMTEHNGEANTSKNRGIPLFHLFLHIGRCLCDRLLLSLHGDRDCHKAALVPGGPQQQRKLEPAQLPLPPPPQLCGQWQRWLNAHCRPSLATAPWERLGYTERLVAHRVEWWLITGCAVKC